MRNTKIPYAHHTFNPWIGCTQCAEGCKNCYAMAMNRRFKWVPEWNGPRVRTSEKYWQQAYRWDRQAAKTGEQTRVMVSMCDPFDLDIDLHLQLCFRQLIQDTPHLTWLLLTKRPENVFESAVSDFNGELPENVWFGFSASTQKEFDTSIELLTDTLTTFPNFIVTSLEPLIEFVSIETGKDVLDWVIIGGEKCAGARPMKFEWIDSIRKECKEYSIPYYFKQFGTWFDKRYLNLYTPVKDREFPHLI